MKRPVSVVIPTYGREGVLVGTLRNIVPLVSPPDELLLVDQTPKHSDETIAALSEWTASGKIKWLRLASPSIPGAMNVGLSAAVGDVVLFLDDDIVPHSNLVEAHRAALREPEMTLVAGQVLQPGEKPTEPEERFRFTDNVAREVDEFIGCNFSVPREWAVMVGGFDEQFVHVAYRYEREFSDRWRERGGRVRFEPRASVRHLKASDGGTRAFGRHLTTVRPSHSVGAFYYHLGARDVRSRIRGVWGTFLSGIATRFHLRHPWWVPVSAVAQVWGFAWALRLRHQGPRLLTGTARP